MEEFFSAALAFPTVLYTILLSVVFIYWGFVIVGALGLDVLDFDIDADGLIDGAAEGAVEGAAEGVAEGLAEGAAEGAVEGAAEGAAEGGAEGITGGIGFMNLLGIGRVPVTVVLSLLILFSWALCYIGMSLSVSLGIGDGVLVSSGIFVASLFVSSMITSVAVRPLFPLFKVHLATQNRDLVGRTCEISTGRVDGRFGQAVLKGEDGGELLIQVRAETPNALRRGSQAVILDYCREREEFQVEGLDNLLPPGA